MTGPNPLVVAPADDRVEPWDSWEGAGVFSSVADLADAVREDGFAPGTVAAGTVAGLDLLGAVMLPLNALGTAGLGWLIEHVAFLHEALDALAGDPARITATARTWQGVADELRAVAAEHRRLDADLAWDGEAAAAYRAASAEFAAGLDAAADEAVAAAQHVLGTGALVGTTRALLRDLIAEFAWAAIRWFLGWLLAAAGTGGALLAVGALYVVVEAVRVATGLQQHLTRLVLQLADATADAALIDQRLHAIELGWRYLVRPAIREVDTWASSAGAPELLELGKQLTGSDGLQDDADEVGR